MTTARSLDRTYPALRTTEGGGFVVHRPFPTRLLMDFDPFLLLDEMGPVDYAPGEARGAPAHPHRGFETVTYVLDGHYRHHDSAGHAGALGPGDVQWMTAGAGILHEEFHSPAFTEKGGLLKMVQLWVNLPAKDKMAPAGYQAITSGQIPAVDLPDGAGVARLIAGSYGGQTGPARTFTPMNVWDLRIRAGKAVRLELPAGWNTGLVVLDGTVQVAGDAIARESQLVVLEAEGTAVEIEANNDASVLLLSGEPIAEPIVGYGPFVMNTQQEIVDAVNDFNSGKFGRMSA